MPATAGWVVRRARAIRRAERSLLLRMLFLMTSTGSNGG
jgi:hypothetical protein